MERKHSLGCPIDIVFNLAYSRMDEDLRREVKNFSQENPWLGDYALYKAIKSKFHTSWMDWPEEFRDRNPQVIESTKKLLADEITYYEFLQYLFYTQWLENKAYINAQGIKVIGDIPMYVSNDSSDVWANRDVFEMDGVSFPNVAGVPPDFFSADGQLWGNPLYNWQRLREGDYWWWMERLGHSLELYDLLRFDHFRALATYYAIPSSETTARNGEWREGPRADFLGRVVDRFGRDTFIAEDLGGEMAPEVISLREEFGLPGMRLVEMSFTPYGVNEIHFPENFTDSHIGYIGTHDNNTLLGWLKNDIQDDQLQIALESVGFENPSELDLEDAETAENVKRAFVEKLWRSGAITTIIQLQDLLGLDENARMNTPATQGGNWNFKIPSSELEKLDANWLREINEKYDRARETPLLNEAELDMN